MKLASLADRTGQVTAAIEREGNWFALPFADLSEALNGGDFSSAVASMTSEAASLPSGWHPVNPLPRPAKVICCGLNFGDHIRETGREFPTHPTLFAKFADTLTGPDDEIAVDHGVELDWEAELAVVVGSELRHADIEIAEKAILGYTVANDFSVRDWQRRTLQWFQGKAWDHSTPLGPVLITADELDPVAGLDVSCRVNGQQVQRGNTRTLVFNAAALLSYISTFTTLRPGDVVLTGTPAGVGMAMTPPRYLRDGDVVETEVEGIGVLRNTVRFASPPPPAPPPPPPPAPASPSSTTGRRSSQR